MPPDGEPRCNVVRAERSGPSRPLGYPEPMPAPSNPDVAWAVEDIRRLLPARERALKYHKGDHPLNFATDKFRNTFGELFQELADNLCDDVVNEPADRLQIEGWSGKYADAASLWWESQRGTARCGSIHQHGFRAGDAFAIVWDDADNVPRLYVQDPREMAVRYSRRRPDELEVAAKCWREGKGYRLNLYYADRIEHWYSKGVSTQSGEKGIPQAGSFQPYERGTVGMDDHVPPVERHDRGRIPVFHFPNGELSQYGTSVLHDVYPLQDGLNKSICDMLVAGEAYALPHRWATGIQIVTDPVTGQEVSPFKNGENLWWTASKDSEFGFFPAAEMKGFLDQQRAFRLAIARKGGLPAHSVDIGATGNAPSGLSLLIAEGKLIKRCKDRQRDWGEVWRDLVAFALSWLGGTVLPQDVEAMWAAVETRDEVALAEVITLKRGLGVSERQGLLELGYTPEEIEQMATDVEEEKARAMDRAQALGGGRISVPGAGTGLPAVPVQPNGAAQPAMAGASA